MNPLARFLMVLLLALAAVMQPLSFGAQQPSPQRAEETKAQTVYVTRTGKRYHRDGCRYLASSAGLLAAPWNPPLHHTGSLPCGGVRFCKMFSYEALTVEYRRRVGIFSLGINQQYKMRRRTVGRSPPRSAWPACTVHVRRYARARTAGHPPLPRQYSNPCAARERSLRTGAASPAAGRALLGGGVRCGA